MFQYNSAINLLSWHPEELGSQLPFKMKRLYRKLASHVSSSRWATQNIYKPGYHDIVDQAS